MLLMKWLKILFLILFSCCLLPTLHAQQTPLDMELDRARQAFDARRYNTAAMLFKKVYDKTKDPDKKGEIAYMIALSYRKSNNIKQAVKWFEELVNTKYPNPDILYLYGESLKYFEQYDDASRQFYDYNFEKPKDPKGKLAMQSCDLAKKWKAKPTRYGIQNLKSINSSSSDYSPFISNNKMYFSSARQEATGNLVFEWTGQKCSDLFEAVKTGDNYQKPLPLKGAVNTPQNEGTIWLDSSGGSMLFTQCNGTDGKGVSCKIYASTWQNGAWSIPMPLPFCSDSFSCGHPSFSQDGKRLFFSSDMKGGLGEKDIYVVSYNAINDKWGTPQNLGPAVNTADDDMFPYIAADNTLYFSSKGHMGMGGLDIYKSTESSGQWSKAENMQYPLNSGGDDFGLVFIPGHERIKPGEVIAYLSSNRQNGQGDDDIYAVSIKPFIFMVKGRVFDKESKSAIAQAKVAIVDGENKAFASLKSGEKGDYIQELPYNNRFNISAEAEGYFKSAEIALSSMNMINDSTATVDIYLEPLPAPEVEFTLKGIYYDLDKFDLRPESKLVLDSLVKILNQNPSITIEIASHTDSRSDEQYNLKLSQKRAESCVDYLLSKGIEKKRLTAVGYGESRLMNDCADGVDCTEEQHQQNRRTTFRVLSTDFNKR